MTDTTAGAAWLAGLDHDPTTFDQFVADYLDGRAGGTTPVAGLPYPGPDDPVYQGAAAIQALATAVDPLVNSRGWRSQSDTSSVTIPTAVWTKVHTNTQDDAGGSGLLYNNGGMTISIGGLYTVEGQVNWNAAGAGGTRIVGVALQAGSGPLGSDPKQGAGGPVSVSMIQSVAATKRYAAGTVIHLWVYQSSGANLTILDRRLTVRRVEY
jgi:hypothetical protein